MKPQRKIEMQLEAFKRKMESYLRDTGTARSKLEREADLTNSTVSNILNGKITNPSISTVIKIADVICCPLDELFSRNIEDGKVFYSEDKSLD